jgi:hypothetical protein
MKRKPTPAQIAARERFAEMARSGAFKKKAKRNPAPIKMKIRGSETPDNPEGIIVTEAGALRFAKQNMPADLKRAGFVASVVAGSRGWSINYGMKVPGHSSYQRNPRAANPIVLVTDRKPSKRKSNPAKPKRVKVQRPFYYIVKVGSAYDGQFLSTHYSLEDVKKIAQQKADKYGAQAKITEFHM